MERQTREQFSTKFGILAATLGSAVGLGNIWKFPALVGQNGGASFLIVYLLSTLVLGLPLMIAEMTMGRRTRANAYATFRRIAPSPRWGVVGAAAVLAAALILAFYSDVAGWVAAYIPKALSGELVTGNPAEAKAVFASLLEDPRQAVGWQWVVLCGTALIIMKGASGGIERITRILIPLLFFLLFAVCLRSLTLPGAERGLAFLFRPDFSRLDGSVVLTATGLAFFKMSLGFGSMITYGSYFKNETHIPLLATRVMFCDLLVSLMAGIAIFPAVFSFGFEPEAGAGLLFLTIPAVFSSIPGGAVFTAVFFILSAVAATGAMLCLLEIPVAWLEQTFRLPRPRATFIITAGILLLGLPPALSTSLWAEIHIFGLSFFDAYDFLTSNILLPVVGFLTSIFIGYIWPEKEFLSALTNNGSLPLSRAGKGIRLCCRSITPVLIFLIIVRGLNIF